MKTFFLSFFLCWTSLLFAQPDLVVSSMHMSNDSVGAGSYVTTTSVFSTISPSGAINNGGFRMIYYLSTDAVYDSGDVSIGGYVHWFGLPIYGSTLPIENRLNVGVATAPGNYYVIAFVDYWNQIVEVDETNNFFVLPITVIAPSPDLVAQPRIYANQGAAGARIAFDMDRENEGLDTSEVCTLGYYFSTDNVLDGTDILIGTGNVGRLAPNRGTRVVDSLTIPNSALIGTAYIITKIDHQDVVLEGNESNNINVFDFTVTGAQLGDYVIEWTAAQPNKANPGERFSIQYKWSNEGEQFLYFGDVGYYLSLDTLLDPSDTYLGDEWTPSMQPDFSEIHTDGILMPSSTPLGNYHLIAYIDKDNYETEGSETNNIIHYPFTVDSITAVPDYALDNAYLVSDTFAVGFYVDSLEIGVTTYNAGRGDLRSTRVYVYVSKDTLLDENDVEISSLYQPILISQDSFVVRAKFPITPLWEAGTYHLFFTVNYSFQNLVAGIDADSSNNVRFTSQTFTIVGDSLYQADVAIDSQATADTVLYAGQSSALTCRLANKSRYNQLRPRVGYYLSKDTLFSGDDLLLGEEYTGFPGLSAYEDTLYVEPITIPLTTEAGQYYILFYADNRRSYVEHNEANNLRFIPLTITPALSDLRLTDAVVSPRWVDPLGRQTQLSYRINNLSNHGLAPECRVAYYYSTNSTLDATDVFLSDNYIDSIPTNGSVWDTVVLTLPNGVTNSGYFLCYVDYLDEHPELNENNNTDWVPVGVTDNYDSLADYTVTFVNAYRVNTTSTYVVDTELRNLGSNPTNISGLGYYLSHTANYNSGMVLLGTSTGTLQSGASSVRTTSVQFSSTTNRGANTILVFGDHLNTEFEFRENNNTAGAFVPGSLSQNVQDLITDNPTVSRRDAWVGDTLRISAGTINTSANGVIVGARMGYFLSRNKTYSSSDVFLGEDTVSVINGATGFVTTSTVTIPDTILPGLYYILYIADHLNTITEASELNNVAFRQIRVNAPTVDLEMVTMTAMPDTTELDGVLEVHYQITNKGTKTARASSVGYYLSYLPFYDSQARLIGHSYLPALDTGNTYQATIQVQIPQVWSGGQQYLIAYVDHWESQIELDERNNTLNQPLFVLGDSTTQADLVVDSVQLDSTTLVVGNSSLLRYQLRNEGGVSTDRPYTTEHYLSIDTLWDPTDLLIGAENEAVLTPSAQQNRSTLISIPLSTPIGAYYLVSIVDPLDQQIEVDNSNNTVYQPLTIRASAADLVVEQPTVQPTLTTAGATVTLNSTIRNQGTDSIAPTLLAYYISTDTLYDNTDIFLGDTLVNGLNAAASQLLQSAIVVPTGTPPGRYYLLYWADYQNSQSESEETNNVNFDTLVIFVPQPDLIVVQAMATPDTIQEGTSTNVTASLRNVGTEVASAYEVGYYLSIDSLYDASDVLLGTLNQSGLGINFTLPSSTTLTIPSGTAAGSYYLLCYSDPTNMVAEVEESNNVFPVAIEVVPTFTNLQQLTHKGVKVYPNPTRGKVIVALAQPHEKIIVRVYNALGQMTLQQMGTSTDRVELDLKGAAGIYTLVLSSEEQVFEVVRVIKK